MSVIGPSPFQRIWIEKLVPATLSLSNQRAVTVLVSV